MGSIGTTVAAVLGNFLASIGNYLPQFVAGLILLLIGLVVAAVLKEVVIRFLAFLKVEEWFSNVTSWFNTLRSERVVRGKVWVGLVSELVRWTIVILFLVPA